MYLGGGESPLADLGTAKASNRLITIRNNGGRVGCLPLGPGGVSKCLLILVFTVRKRGGGVCLSACWDTP